MHGENPTSPTGNRYAVSPATATQADYDSNRPIPYAGFWRRAGAYTIDYFIVGFVGRVFAMGFGGPAHQSTNSLFLLIYLIGACLYYVLFESSEMQATPGKRALGLKVTDLQGEQISFGRALGRLLGHVPSYLIFGIGFAMAVFTERRQTLHDKMAGTLVVHREESSDDIAQAGIAPPAPLWQSIVAAPYKAAVESAIAAGTPLEAIDSSKVDVSLPDSVKYVDSVRVSRGIVDIQYGRSANKKIAGGHLLLMPGVKGAEVQWYCGRATPAADATVPVEDYQRFTSIPDNVLPMSCRSR